MKTFVTALIPDIKDVLSIERPLMAVDFSQLVGRYRFCPFEVSDRTNPKILHSVEWRDEAQLRTVGADSSLDTGGIIKKQVSRH